MAGDRESDLLKNRDFGRLLKIGLEAPITQVQEATSIYFIYFESIF